MRDSARDPRAVMTRPAPPPHLELRYGPLPDHVVDVRLPVRRADEDPGASPVVVVLHGGFWRAAFDRTSTGSMSVALAAAGYTVAVPEYRRTAAGGGWPHTLDDVAAVLDTLPDLLADALRTADVRADPTRMVVVGHSAGGHLALWAAARSRLPAVSPWYRRTDRGLRGVVSLAGVCDLAEGFRRGLGSSAVQELLGGSPQEVPVRYAAADPAALLPADVPTVVVHGDADLQVPVQLSRDYATRAHGAGGDVRLVELPGADHFAVIDPETSAWPHVLAAVDSLLPPGGV